MHYDFESASHVDDYLKAIADSEEFIAKYDTKNGIIVLNYVFTCPTSFPNPNTLEGEARRLAILRRDCRGLKFDIETGDVVAKPYHKFFNCNEKPETQINAIDWNQPHVVLEKLDGSMLTPFKRKDGYFQWHTKMGPTAVAEPVNQFADARYIAFCEAMREEGITPIFEWCSRIQRIVIDYPTDQLILTALRGTHSGRYMSYGRMVEYANQFTIPVVQNIADSVGEAERFIETTAELKNAEGYVVRFDNGHMCKVKGAWYCRIHNTKEILVFEKNVWNLVLQESVDDAKQFMEARDRAIFEDFATEFNNKVRHKAADLAEFVEKLKISGFDKKTFAIQIAPSVQGQERGLMFSIWDGRDPVTVVKNFLLKNVGTQRTIDDVRHFVDLNWKEFYYAPTE